MHPSEIDLGLSRIHSVATSLKLFHAGEESAINSDGSSPTVITVAGTNGKGSFVRSCESILKSNGLHFGCFSSPHIRRYNERIRVDGKELDDDFICELFKEIDIARGDTSLTYFEFGTLAALLAFHTLNCEYWVLEVGLGGRLDAVNIVDADVGVITTIGLDHESWLGNTVDLIGREKAGILRPGQTVVLASEDLPASVYDVANKLDTRCLQKGREFNYSFSNDGLNVHLAGGEPLLLKACRLPAASVVAALQVMETLKLDVSSDAVVKNLSQIGLEGRFEVVQGNSGRVFVFDVAHNPMAMQLLAENITRYKKAHHVTDVVCILGMMADKNIEASLKELAPVVTEWLVCDLPGNQRAAKSADLHSAVSELVSKPVHPCSSVGVAIKNRLAQTGNHCAQLTLVCGSFFTVCDAKAELKESGEYEWMTG